LQEHFAGGKNCQPCRFWALSDTTPQIAQRFACFFVAPGFRQFGRGGAAH
jgi:hypothetical protein